ncbi:MAG: hypothetical protein AB4038_16540 [Prochloraceae cyanobacterium]
MNSQVQILIEYHLIDSSEWYLVELAPEEYFDLDYLAPDDKIMWDCIPKYVDTIEYLDIDSNQVANIRLKIIDPEVKIIKSVAETFWNEGKNKITEVTHTEKEKISYWETIVDIQLQALPLISEILRFYRDDNMPKLAYHGIIKDREDGSQEETIIYPKNQDFNQ